MGFVFSMPHSIPQFSHTRPVHLPNAKRRVEDALPLEPRASRTLRSPEKNYGAVGEDAEEERFRAVPVVAYRKARRRLFGIGRARLPTSALLQHDFACRRERIVTNGEARARPGDRSGTADGQRAADGRERRVREREGRAGRNARVARSGNRRCVSILCPPSSVLCPFPNMALSYHTPPFPRKPKFAPPRRRLPMFRAPNARTRELFETRSRSAVKRGARQVCALPLPIGSRRQSPRIAIRRAKGIEP